MIYNHIKYKLDLRVKISAMAIVERVRENLFTGQSGSKLKNKYTTINILSIFSKLFANTQVIFVKFELVTPTYD